MESEDTRDLKSLAPQGRAGSSPASPSGHAFLAIPTVSAREKPLPGPVPIGDAAISAGLRKVAPAWNPPSGGAESGVGQPSSPAKRHGHQQVEMSGPGDSQDGDEAGAGGIGEKERGRAIRPPPPPRCGGAVGWPRPSVFRCSNLVGLSRGRSIRDRRLLVQAAGGHGPGGGRDQAGKGCESGGGSPYQSLLMTSPPARVATAIQVGRLMELVTKRTLPSPRSTLTPLA